MKRLLSVLLAVVLIGGAFFAAPGAFALGEQQPGISIDKTYLLTGEPLSVNNPNNYELKILVGENEVEAEGFVLRPEYYESWITLQAYDSGELIDEDKAYFSKLPVVYIGTEDGEGITSKEKYKSGEMFIQNNTAADAAEYSGEISIKGRGNSTWGWPKKPYKIKLDKKTDLFGMGKNKHWVLLANYLDESLLRNTTGFQVSEQLGLTAMHSVWVDLILNGEYSGNYQLCEHIRVDESRVDIFDWENEAKEVASAVSKAEKKAGNTIDKDDLEDYLTQNLAWITSGSFSFGGKAYTVSDYYELDGDITGGYLFELSNEYDEVSKFMTESKLKVMLKSPEFLNTNPEMKKYVQDYWQDFENAYMSEDGYAETTEGKKHYSELADFDSMVAYWLALEILGNNDAKYKSRYAYKDKGEKLTFGPVWDFDWGCGSQKVGTSATGWKLTNFENEQSFFKEYLDDPLFICKATEMYWRVRPYLESLIAQGGILDQEAEYLYESGMADSAAWNRTDFWPNTARGYQKDTEYFIYYMRRRINWLDTQFAADDTLLKSAYYDKSAYPYTKAGSELGVVLTNASVDKITAKAPADGVVSAGDGVSAAVFTNGDTASVNVYVNGLFLCETPVADSEAHIEIPAESLTAQAGSKNVVSLIGKTSDGKTTYKNFFTIIQSDSAAQPAVGDADTDGEVTVMDATRIQRYIAELSPSVTVMNMRAASVTGENELSILDATCIQRRIAGLITAFPAENAPV